MIMPNKADRSTDAETQERLVPASFLRDSPYGRLERRNRKWYLVDGRPDVTMKLCRIFTGISTRNRRNISLPITMPGFWTELNWFMKLFPLAVSDADRKSLERVIAKDLAHTDAVITFNTHMDRPALVDIPLKQPLRQYQKKAVDAICLQKRLLVADDVGLGKTAVAIASMLHERCTPALYVTMSQLSEQAVQEFGKFAEVVCIDTQGVRRTIGEDKPLGSVSEGALVLHQIDRIAAYELPAADVYIMKYSCLRGWRDVFDAKVFRYVVFDECQQLRRKGTAKYRAAQAASRHAEFSVGLTATPIYNYGDEIFNVLNLLRPRCLGKYAEFVAEWGTPTRFGRVIVENPGALGAVLKEHLFMIRRTMPEVGLELPEVQHVVEHVDHDVKLFNQSLGEILELAKRTLFGFTAEERMTSSGQLDVRLRHATGVSKAHYVAARARIVLESGRPVILVGWHRDTYDIWRELLAEHEPVMITGSESARRKEQNKQAFIRGDSKLLILSLRSGEGMDGLQDTCSIVVFGELDWSPQIHHQIIGRLHRFGQQDSVLALFLVSREGSDPPMENLLDLKSEQAFKIMNPGETYSPILTSHGGEKRLQEIAGEILRHYKVDLDKARAEFEVKEPPGYWGVIAALESFVWDRDHDEKRCQERLYAFLQDIGIDAQREVSVNGGIIDMLTDSGVGIEMKLAPVTRGELVRQVRTYIQDERIRAIVAVTLQPGELPERLYGKRIAEVGLRTTAALSL